MSVTTTLISVPQLQALQQQAQPPLLIDVRFDLADTAAGELAYGQGHLPGAHYLHLDRDLSGPKHDETGAFRGRHPLPQREAFAARMAALGLSTGRQVVAYDAQDGIYAARLWWMLRWLGHEAAAVLDGGLQAWLAAGAPLTGEVPAARPAAFSAGGSLAPSSDIAALLAAPGRLQVVDARAGARFRGEVEPLDKQAGHIPGALNRFYKDNLDADGRFKPAATLREDFQTLLGARPIDEVVHQCGSGVTACHNLLAMEHAGLKGSRLYPGSWSEWSADPTRPVARG